MPYASQPFISIIIPVKKLNNFIEEAVPYFKNLKWEKYEILILPDRHETKNKYWKKTRIIKTGHVGPAKKRDIGAMKAKGKILAFIDDDAYPHQDWLKNGVANFRRSDIAAVGGPGITPPYVSKLEQISGWINASPIGAGPYGYRCLPSQKRYVDDYPAMNLMIRKTDFKKVGGFNTHYYPGEDTKLCLDLINLGKKIIYEPKAIVFHHRRPVLLPFLRQTGNYAIHRGFFVKKLPETSAKIAYFMPSCLVLNILLLTISQFFQGSIKYLFSLPILFYVVLVISNSGWIWYKSKLIGVAILSLPTLVLTHLWYGLRFLQGLFLVKKLKS